MVGRDLTDLPDELQLMIVEKIQENDKKDSLDLSRDLIRWSSTSMYFRRLLTPYIFTSVILRIDEENKKDVQHLLNGSCAALIKDLSIVGPTRSGFHSLYWNYFEYGESPEDILLPSVVEEMLSSLHAFPAVESVSISLPCPFHISSLEDHQELMSRHLDEDYEWEDMPDEFECQFYEAWQDLMDKVYSHFSASQSHTFALEIRDFAWHYTRPFFKSRFQKFLTRVKGFTLILDKVGDVNGRDMMDEQVDFLSGSFIQFASHLNSVTSLTLASSDERSMSLSGLTISTPQYDNKSMPNLKYLKLE